MVVTFLTRRGVSWHGGARVRSGRRDISSPVQVVKDRGLDRPVQERKGQTDQGIYLQS